MIIKKQYDFISMIKTIIGLLATLIMINFIIAVFFRGHFNELSEMLDTENLIVECKVKNILEIIYSAPVTLNVEKKERNNVLFRKPKRIYGNNIYSVETGTSRNTFLVYWELIENFVEIIRIEDYKTKEIIFENGKEDRSVN